MSTVIALKLNPHQSVLIADESTWHLGHAYSYRRSNYGDAMARLLDEPVEERCGIRAVYAGTGFPSLHHEVARKARSTLAEAERSGGLKDAEGLSRHVQEAFSAAHRRILDDKLRFNYGVGLDDINARSFRSGADRLELRQDPVIKAARAFASGQGSSNMHLRLFDNQAILVAHDNLRGLQGWYLDRSGRASGFATPAMVIGHGSQVATHVMTRFTNRMDLAQRREGFSLEDGLFVALLLATEVHSTINMMGGYFQVMILRAGAPIREIVSDSSHLAREVMQAHLWGFLDRSTATDLMVRLLLEDEDLDDVEEDFFRQASNPTLLQRYLMGFKPRRAPAHADLPAGRASAAPPSPGAAKGRTRKTSSNSSREKRSRKVLGAIETAGTKTAPPRPRARRRKQ